MTMTAAETPDDEPSQGNLAAALAAYYRDRVGGIDQLLQACQGRMTTLARRLLRGHPEIRMGCHDTIDIVSLATHRLFNAIRDVQPETEKHLMALAALQVRREVIDLARKFGGPRSADRDRVPNSTDHDTHAIDLAAGAVAECDSPTSHDEMEAFHTAVDGLPEELREVFAMRFYLGATVAEVAKAISCAPRTVKRRWKVAKDRLEAALSTL